MTAVYWPPDEYDCTPASRAIEREDTEHQHLASERLACEAFVKHAGAYHCGAPGDICAWPAPCLFHAGRRYHCIRGPGGLVRDVRP